MKIYTRTGDAGETGLFGGGRVPKSDPRVEAYGTVDEANALVGLARAELAAERPDHELDGILDGLQAGLFALGADLATPLDAPARGHVQALGDADVTELERLIDRLDEELGPLTAFVLPGGARAAAALHVARAVIRRAERATVTAMAAVPVNGAALRYLNRASDLLFTLARVMNARAGRAEATWGGRRGG